MNWNLISRITVSAVGGFNLGTLIFLGLSFVFPVTYITLAAISFAGFVGFFKALKD